MVGHHLAHRKCLFSSQPAAYRVLHLTLEKGMNKNYKLPDILKLGLDIVFCGTAAGKKSAAVGHYYANPSNRFWQILCDTGLTPTKMKPEEDKDVLKFSIGLTDLVKDEAGRDHEIEGLSHKAALRERVRIILHTYAPQHLAFVGKGKSAVADALGVQQLNWGRQPEHPEFSGTQIWVLPDPSDGNEHFIRLRCHWFVLADAVK